jgi:oxaloacetate decarboxylase gamma subunit
MPVSDLLIEGLKLLALGMGSVFAFLVVLVFAMMAMSRLAAAVSGEVPAQGQGETAADPDAGVLAAISAAVAHYRSRRH